MRQELYLGIMTGTSLDAIDVAICSFDRDQVHLAAFHSSQWPAALRDILLDIATAESVPLDLLARCHFLLAHYYADAVKAALDDAKLQSRDIRAIGLHGQTIRHLPVPFSLKGLAPVGATLQWGSGAALAALTGIDVVSDFRSGDIALGGQGAPLVPMFDLAFLRSETRNRLITNVGGISNVTWIPAAGDPEHVVAFDCGPGNMMIDLLTKRYFNEPYDRDGHHGRSGRIDEAMVQALLSHEFFHLPPPKSTGRELFGESFLKPVYNMIEANTLSADDAIATVTELTARSIAQSLDVIGTRENTDIFISGGGGFNKYLLERIQANANGSSVETSSALGIPLDAKEAIAFAFFAKAFLENIVIHLPRTTGASRSILLGSLSKGRVA